MSNTVRVVFPTQLLANSDQYWRQSTLAKLLGKANVESITFADIYLYLSSEMLDLHFSQQDVPVAAIETLSLGKQYQKSDWMACLDPVSVCPNRDHLVLSRLESERFNEDNETSLISALNQFLKKYELDLYQVNDKHWCVHSVRSFDIRTHSLNQVIGQNIIHCLPFGADEINWRSWINEIQMWLQAFKGPQQYEFSSGVLPNSVWLWGSGCLPEKGYLKQQWSSVVSDQAFAKGLALLGEIHSLSYDEFFRSQRKTTNQQPRTLIYLEGHPFNSLEYMDSQLIVPLYDLLRSKHIDNLELDFPTGHRYRLRRSNLLRFWKKAVPML